LEKDMKKTLRILSMILVFALMLGCVMALASCTNAKDDEKKETKPYSDPEKAAEALENAGYTVRLLTDEDYLNEQGIEATIYAVNGDGEMISIAYYFDSDEAKEGYEEAKEEREDLGDKYEVGKSDKMVWLGTKAAIKAASEGVTRQMMTIERVSTEPYEVEISHRDVSEIANKVKHVPAEFINERGNHITDECARYLLPLIQGELDVKYENGIPKHIII